MTFHHEGHDGDVTQPENLLVDARPWTVEVPMEPAQAAPLLDPLVQLGEIVFGNRGRAVPHHVAAEGMQESLCLVEPSLLDFELTTASKRRARFECGATQWDLQLTDHRVRPQVLRQPPGLHDLDDVGFGQATRVVPATEPGHAARRVAHQARCGSAGHSVVAAEPPPLLIAAWDHAPCAVEVRIRG